jgi:hypothetical protein
MMRCPLPWYALSVARKASDNIGSIIKADLERSGRFRALPDSQLPAQPNSGTGHQLHTMASR